MIEELLSKRLSMKNLIVAVASHIDSDCIQALSENDTIMLYFGSSIMVPQGKSAITNGQSRM